jgi:tellurite resistance protein TerC
MIRGVFIAAAALLEAFSFTLLIFGVGLLITAVQLFRHRDEDPHLDDNALVGLARRALPLTSTYDGKRIVTFQDGRRVATPLLLALLAIGTTDLLFAFDSVRAVFGVTHRAYIVFAANAFALLGLRPLFFLISELLDRLVYVSTGLAAILGFIGVKFGLEFAHRSVAGVPEISTGASLAVIATILIVTAGASVIRSRRPPKLRRHAGALRSRRPTRRSVGTANGDQGSRTDERSPTGCETRSGAGSGVITCPPASRPRHNRSIVKRRSRASGSA